MFNLAMNFAWSGLDEYGSAGGIRRDNHSFAVTII
jgi:hypothetical protein